MNKQSKEALVAEFAEKLKAAKAAFLADYRGLDVDQANALTRKAKADLKAKGVSIPMPTPIGGGEYFDVAQGSVRI